MFKDGLLVGIARTELMTYKQVLARLYRMNLRELAQEATVLDNNTGELLTITDIWEVDDPDSADHGLFHLKVEE